MPRKYVKKTEYTAPDSAMVCGMLKAVKIDNQKPYAVSQQYDVSKDVVYRLVAAFEKQYQRISRFPNKLFDRLPTHGMLKKVFPR